MSKTLKLTATQVRRDFFNILDLVFQQDFQVHISKKGMAEAVVLKKAQVVYDQPGKKDIDLVKDTAGALKTSGYNVNEISDSQDDLIKEYFDKNPKGPNA